MRYMMMPFDQHSDRGLGAMGDAFEDAANALELPTTENLGQHQHLPIAFLRRHAVELYLKSMIVIVHRSLRLNYGDSPCDGPPFVLFKGQWRRLDNTHDIVCLWDYWLHVIRTSAPELTKRCKTDWQAVPPGIDTAIRAVGTVDPRSTYCRYPDLAGGTPDDERSSWKAKSPEDVQAEVENSPHAVKLSLTVGPDGEVVSAAQLDDAPLAEFSKQLREVAEALSGAHIGLRCELADGT